MDPISRPKSSKVGEASVLLSYGVFMFQNSKSYLIFQDSLTGSLHSPMFVTGHRPMAWPIPVQYSLAQLQYLPHQNWLGLRTFWLRKTIELSLRRKEEGLRIRSSPWNVMFFRTTKRRKRRFPRSGLLRIPYLPQMAHAIRLLYSLQRDISILSKQAQEVG